MVIRQALTPLRNARHVLPASESTAVSPFNFEGKFDVRIAVEDGEPWFVARDVADALGYKWQVNLIGHVPDECKGVKRINTLAIRDSAGVLQRHTTCHAATGTR